MLESQSFMVDLKSMYICLFDSSASALAMNTQTFILALKKKKTLLYKLLCNYLQKMLLKNSVGIQKYINIDSPI